MDKKQESNTENPDIEIIKLVNKRFKEAKKYRDQFEEEWRECEDFYNGKHWKDKNRSFKNLVFPLIEQEVSVLSDALPSTDILAHDSAREEDAKVLEASVHFTYEQQAFYLKFVMAMRSALKTGTGFHYVDYDPDAEGGQGITTIKNIPWEHVYLDPSSSEIDEGFVGIKFHIRTSEAKRKYPKFADQIKSCGPDSEQTSSGSGLKEDRANYRSSSTSTEDKYQIEDMCIVEEAWLRDYTMIDIPEEETIAEIQKETEQFFNGTNPDITKYDDHAKHIQAHEAQKIAIASQALGLAPQDITEADIEALKQDPELGLVIMMIDDHNEIHKQYLKENPKSQRPKYESNVRLVIKIGELIVYDGNPPVDDKGMVPLVPYYCYKDEQSIWGVGEVKNILPAQKSFNEMDNAEYESLHLTANPGWVMDSRAGIKPSEITNKRGKVYVVNENARFERLQPGQTSPQLQTRKQSDHQYMQIVTGMNEFSQGRADGGVTAASAIQQIIGQTNGRLRLKSYQSALYSIPRMSKLVARRNAKYWTSERMMRVTDNTTGAARLIKFDPEQVKDLDYDVRVTQGTLAGADKETQEKILETYVDKGWLPPKVFFQITNVPNKQKVLEALDEVDQQKMLLQQLAAENEQLKAIVNGAPVPGQPAKTAPQKP